MDSLKFLAVIPARYASTRFPGKPLARLGGEPVIRYVWKQVTQVFADAAVATDDPRIYDAVEAFGGRAVMTSPDHRSGTDRCREAVDKLGGDPDVIVNVQGDEPFIAPSQLQAIAAASTIRRPTSPRSSNPSPRPTDSTHWKIPIRRKSCSAARARHSISRAR